MRSSGARTLTASISSMTSLACIGDGEALCGGGIVHEDVDTAEDGERLLGDGSGGFRLAAGRPSGCSGS